jgi:guanylate cyclase soluble subunit beta
MYGLINGTLKDLINEKYGDETWNRIVSVSNVANDSFLSMNIYDDATTYDLVNAGSKVLGMPPEALLEMFGEYWIAETGAKYFGTLMQATGNHLIEFLDNLNVLHDRITDAFVDYVPPDFRVETLTAGHYRIHYVSKREGLTPFVVGLLNGLATRFDQKMEIISQKAVPVTSGEHTVFEVTVA